MHLSFLQQKKIIRSHQLERANAVLFSLRSVNIKSNNFLTKFDVCFDILVFGASLSGNEKENWSQK